MKTVHAISLLTLLLVSLSSGFVGSRSAASVTIVDDLDRNITIDVYPPQRIVSLAPSCTEILFAIGAGSQVVAVDTYSDYPPEAVGLPKVGGFGTISIEAVVDLHPDLILSTAGVQLPYVDQLSGLGYPVVVLNPADVNGVIDDVALVGEATGNIEGANRVVQTMRDKISWVASRVAAESHSTPRVYFELWHDPYMSFGPNTWVDEIITKAGGRNIFHDSISQYPIVNSETIIECNPEFIILQSHSAGGRTAEEVKTRTGWNFIAAVQNDKIYIVDENLFLRPGPRIVDGLYTLTSILHPEIISMQTSLKPTSVTMAVDLPIIEMPFTMDLPLVKAGETLEVAGSTEPALNGSLIFQAFNGIGTGEIIRGIIVENGTYSFTWQLPSERKWMVLKIFVIFVPDNKSYETSVSEPIDMIVIPPMLIPRY